MNKLFLILFVTLFATKTFGQITGAGVVCVGDTIVLHGPSGGFWVNGDTTIAVIDSFTGVLIGRTAGTVTIGYMTSLTAYSKTITVNPTPVLSSTLTPPAICDSFIFNYTPASSTAGTIFAWSRAVIPGITAGASSGAGNPNEQLINTTFTTVGVAYVYTLTAAGCTNVQTVTINVLPSPKLSSTLTPDAICDSALFSYVPASLTPATSFSWNRPFTTGIILPSAFGSGPINEYLDNTTTTPITVTYYYRMSVGGCTSLYIETIQVVVGTCRVGIPELNQEDDINVYPNPSSGAFTVEAPADASISVADLAGRVLVVHTGVPGVTSIVVKTVFEDRLLPGTYLVKVTSAERTYVQKVVIW